MESNNFEKKLIDIRACNDAISFCKGKTLQEAWEQCERGDWMLWLYKRACNFDIQKMHLAKGHCAETVIHLMKDERSILAVKAAIDFGNGEITMGELKAAAYAAYAANDAAYAAAYAADAAANDADAKKQNQKLTADICRKYLPIPQFT